MTRLGAGSLRDPAGQTLPLGSGALCAAIVVLPLGSRVIIWHFPGQDADPGSGIVGIVIVAIPLEQLVLAQHSPELVVAQGQQIGRFALIILGLLHRLLE